VVDVPWGFYEEALPELMRHKRAPLHPVEVGLYAAAKQARADGFDTLVVGIGADSTFGGLDKLLSRDWKFGQFVERYTFLDPSRALREPVDMRHVFEPYRRGASDIDVQGFLKVVHGLGIVQAFENALEAGGCKMVCPFESIALDAPLDLARIRGGESKYLLRTVFRELFEGVEVPEKIAFARPMDVWLGRWDGPKREEFLPRSGADDWFARLTGEQRWLIYCLERFLNLLDRE
jgi:asparagine synthetase B (glutamine-hydrolysing)